MRLDILKSLNAERAARRAAIVVTDLATGAQRFDSGRVRAVGVADEQRSLVQPDGVPALRALIAFEPAEHRER